MSTKKRRPGYYGAIYGDLHKSKKWAGGLHPNGKTYARLSWQARGLWAEMLSRVVDGKTNGRLAESEVLELDKGAARWLGELVANDLVRREGDALNLHQYDEHNITTFEHAHKNALAAERMANMRRAFDSSSSDVTRNEPRTNGERSSKVTGNALTLSPSEIDLRSERETVTRNEPRTSARRLSALCEQARALVATACRSRKVGPPMQVSYPDSADWIALAKWAVLTEAARADGDGLKAEAAIDFAVTEWLATDAAKSGFNPHWFSIDPNKYFLREAIEARQAREAKASA